MLKRFHIEGTFLRSAVARRVFLLFVLSAFVPVAILAALSYRQVYTVVSESSQQQLAGSAAAYARSVFDRLLGASLMLNGDAAQIRGAGHGVGTSSEALRAAFLRVYLTANGQASERLGSASHASAPPLATDAQALKHLADGEAVLALVPSAGSTPSLWLTLAVDTKQPALGLLVAELDPLYVWGDPETLSYQTGVCVLTQDALVLSCSNDALQSVAVRAAQPGAVAPPANPDAWLTASKVLFLKAQFAAASWNVIAMRPGGLAITALTQMAQTLSGISLLTLLLVALLSVVQIRRTLVPLERLIEGTQRIAREEFDQPVRVTRHDEFGQLADSLNGMAARLGQNISAMRALSEIDQHILSHRDLPQIVEHVQRRVLDLLPKAMVGIVVPDDVTTELGTVYVWHATQPHANQVREPLAALCLSQYLPHPEGIWLGADDARVPQAMTPRDNVVVSHCFVLPILGRDAVVGLMLLGVAEQSDVPARTLNQVRDLGARVGVALAAHAHEAQLVHLAHHDGLTGLPNRLLLRERLQQEMSHARRDGGRAALLFIDLDRFKNINDTLGHDAGDQLLCQVAERLSAHVRDCDTVARLGGDEFVVLQTRMPSPQHAATLADKLLQVLAQPFQLGGGEHFVGGSMGIAVFPDDGQTVEDLLKCADIAMYRAKDAGRGGGVFYEEGMNQELQERAMLEHELRLAIARNQLMMHYQPRFRLRDGRLVGAEALIRWQHPELGWVSPARFIPLAEENGLIDEIGPWVLRQVCQQLAVWQAQGYEIGNVAVNVSGRQLRTSNLVDLVRDALHTSGLPSKLLEIEVTEGVLINDIERVIGLLDQIQHLGVAIALDDFGTGYSSMSYLRRLPIDVLKVDQSFVRDLTQDEGSRSIVQAIIALAHALGKTVVAEGVETQEQADLLATWGCEEVQGYYFSRPVSAQALEQLMHKAE